MNREDIVEIIDKEKLVFVTRLKDQEQIPRVIKSLSNAGVKVLEITSNTPNYAEEITKARRLYPNILIGAGTVINKKIAKEAIEAGAQFLVTPNTNPSLVNLAHQSNIPILMGAVTPTEVCIASEAGADFVKLFPADIMGIPYFKSIKRPLDKVKLLAVGGIELNMVNDWFEAGVNGIASVLQDDLEGDEDFLKIEQNASNFINLIKQL